MNDYKEKRKKSFKKLKIVLIGLTSCFSLFLFIFGLIMVIYRYDTNTSVFGVILLTLSVAVFISDIFIIKFWKPDNFINLKYEDETSKKITEIEKEIEEIKRKNNL